MLVKEKKNIELRGAIQPISRIQTAEGWKRSSIRLHRREKVAVKR